MARAEDRKAAGQIKESSLRLLVVTPSADNKTAPSPFPAFLQRLTGTAPTVDTSTFAGYTSHPALHLKTRYYDTNVGIWCDELPPADNGSAPPDSRQDSESFPKLEEWEKQMLSSEAQEVRDVIGGIVLLLPLLGGISNAAPETQLRSQNTTWISYIDALSGLRDAIEEDSGRDVAGVVLLQAAGPNSSASTDSPAGANGQNFEILRERLEEECLMTHGLIGWEYIVWSDVNPATAPATGDGGSLDLQTRNEAGEKTGFPRVLEVLEAIDWSTEPTMLHADDEDELDDLMNDEDDSLEFLDDDSPLPTGTTTGGRHSYSNINRTRLRSPPDLDTGLGIPTITEGLLAQDQREFQREMLGLKMAMLDIEDGGDSGTRHGHSHSHSLAPSSLAGEFDADDFQSRTPLPKVRGTGTGTGTTLSRSSTEDGPPVGRRDGSDGLDAAAAATAAEDEGNAVQVEQLSGLMERVLAMREAAADLSGPAERERFARREVKRLMKELK